MSAGGALFALSAVQAVSQIGQGYAERAEMNYNASVMEAKAGMITAKKEIEAGQYARMSGKAASTTMQRVGVAGIRPSGSPMAVLVDTLSQIEIDKAIGQFNLEQEKQFTQAQASAYRRKGSMAVRQGWTNALASGIQGYGNYKLYSGGVKTTTPSGNPRFNGMYTSYTGWRG